MDGLVEELLRFESAKHEALVLIDAAAYEASVREQMRLLAVACDEDKKASDCERLLSLSTDHAQHPPLTKSDIDQSSIRL